MVSRQQLEESAQSALDAVCRSEAQTYDQFMAGFTYLTQEDLRKAELSKAKKDMRSEGDVANAPAVDGLATAGMRGADAIVAATSNDANPDTDTFEVVKIMFSLYFLAFGFVPSNSIGCDHTYLNCIAIQSAFLWQTEML